MIGRVVGSWRVIELLGEGGMGSVYMGEHPAIGSKVAIKILHPRFDADERIVERFFNEAKAVNVIGHENIVSILDFNVADGRRHYFVMEFLHGRALQALVEAGTPLPLERTGSILLQCCRALQAAHERGIVHRDFKPDNVFLVDRSGRADFVKLVDFGIAKLTDTSNAHLTQTGTVMGTPAYMSPEQAAGDSSIDARSDIYSLGVTMFQMVTGKLPFADAGPSFGRILAAHLQQAPPLPRAPASPSRSQRCCSCGPRGPARPRRGNRARCQRNPFPCRPAAARSRPRRVRRRRRRTLPPCRPVLRAVTRRPFLRARADRSA